MNEINANARLRVAAAEKADAEKIMQVRFTLLRGERRPCPIDSHDVQHPNQTTTIQQVKAAEASAEAKYLNGLGIARERKAIVEGLRESVEQFSESVEGATAAEVFDILTLLQSLEMLKDVGNNPNNPTPLFVQHGPSAVMELKEQLRSGIGGGGQGAAAK